MRALPLILLVPLCCCSAPAPWAANIPAPWEAAENPQREPSMVLAVAPQGQQWERIGSSVRGKAIQAATIGSGTRRIYVIGGTHGELPDLLAQGLSGATVRVIRDMNPDGSAAKTKTNTRGVDLNRNWAARDYRKADTRCGTGPASELETVSVQKDMAAFKPDLVLVISSSARGPVVGFDGPAQFAAYEFAAGARREEPRWRVVPDRWKPAPGSAESFVWQILKRPVLSVELQRGSDTSARALLAGLDSLAAMEEPKKPAPPAAKGAPARPVR
jgi:hypothetical protein